MFASTDFVLNIPSNVANPDIRALALAAGWNNANKLVVNITAALVNGLNFSGVYPGGLKLKISPSTLVGGTINGGTAIYTRTSIEIENNGKIYGGGGKGAYGSSYLFRYREFYDNIDAYGGEGGRGQGFASTSSLTILAAQPGEAGVYAAYSGPSFGDPLPYARGEDGGNGGTWGASGGYETGGGYYGGSMSYFQVSGPFEPSPAGYYLNGIAYVTWANVGDVKGRLI